MFGRIASTTVRCQEEGSSIDQQQRRRAHDACPQIKGKNETTTAEQYHSAWAGGGYFTMMSVSSTVLYCPGHGHTCAVNPSVAVTDHPART